MRVAAILTCVCLLAPFALADEPKAAWQKAGAHPGWMVLDQFMLKYSPNKGREREFPAFQWWKSTTELPEKLPDLDKEFGLDLSGYQGSLKPLAGLKRLRSLSLAEAKVSDDDLKHLPPGLKELVLSKTKVTDGGLKHLAALKNLESLDLGYTDVKSLKDITGLEKLHTLNLIYTQVGDAGMVEAAKMKSLDWIGIRQSRVKSAAAFQKAKPRAHVFW